MGNGDWNQNSCHESRLNGKVVSFLLLSSGEWGLKPKVVSWIQIEWKSGFILTSQQWGMGIENKSRVMNPDWMEKWFHSRFLIPLLYSTTYRVALAVGNGDWNQMSCHESRLNGKVVSFSLLSGGEWGLKTKVVSWIQIEWKSGFILASLSHFYIVLVWGMGIETKSRVMNPDWMEKWFHSRFLIPLLYSTTYSSGEWGLKPKVVSWIQIEWKSGFILASISRFYIVLPIAVGNGDWNQMSCHESRLNGKVVSFSLPYPTSI